MDYENYIKTGKRVLYTWKEYDYYRAVAKGYGTIPYVEKSEIVTISGQMREKSSKRFASVSELHRFFAREDDFEIQVKNDKGEKFFVGIDEISPYAEIGELSFDDLKTLRDEIGVGSLFLTDYENSFGVDKTQLCALCDDYLIYLESEYGEEYWSHDTPEEFANFAAA